MGCSIGVCKRLIAADERRWTRIGFESQRQDIDFKAFDFISGQLVFEFSGEHECTWRFVAIVNTAVKKMAKAIAAKSPSTVI
ncbi:hypothetical protein [Geothermobacter ehrlichii]|uniref:hypothetical protein n=1 Tax=Geothermobacter ehrlichii TaxID=213224 RepID=UPI0011E7A015|nr:hypothetical protein [Geothermobacter ehrlichii]